MSITGKCKFNHLSGFNNSDQESRSQGKRLESLRKEKIGGGVEEVDETGEEEGGVEGGEEEDGGGGEGGGADDQGEQEGGQEEQQLGQGFPGNARTCKSKTLLEGLGNEWMKGATLWE